MIEFYTAGTPNGQKIAIMLEEVGLDYNVHRLDFARDEQKTPAYLTINPNGKIPAIVDEVGLGDGPVTVFESGAILIYLADKSGQLLSAEPRKRLETLQWLMFQMAGVGPTFGQASHWRRADPASPPATERYMSEANRLLGVLERRLEAMTFLAGDDYTIADVATWPWVNAYGFIGLDIAAYPAVDRWHLQILGRPAVGRGMAVAPPPS
jgi:GST-like protein